MDKNLVKVVEKGEELYPEKLAEIDNPPERLFCIGDLRLLKKRAVAVVGSRKASEYGKQVAMRIGKEAAENGVVLVSGMAKGIDSFGHLGALKSKGETIAVLGCGIDVCYPKENMKLYEEIKESGLIVSEYPPGTAPKPYMFPERNRIISALSEVIVVVEAGTNSGSLITAEIGASQGKTVMAVPGNINAHFSLGTNKLIADGAAIVTVVDDVFLAMGVEPSISEEEKAQLGEGEEALYRLVKEQGEVSTDFLCSTLNKTIVEVNGLVTVLEMKGLVAYSLGRIFAVK